MTTPARRRSLALLGLTAAAAVIAGIAGADGTDLGDVLADRPETSTTARAVAPTPADELVAATVFDQLPAPDLIDVRAIREAREDLVPRTPEPAARAARTAESEPQSAPEHEHEPAPEPEPAPEHEHEPAPAPQSASDAWSGVASWYGPNFHGRTTANGETFDQWAMTAAHKTLPFGTVLRVTNPSNGRSVEVRINDRGPFIAGRSIDLSRAAAEAIGIGGVAPVELAEL